MDDPPIASTESCAHNQLNIGIEQERFVELPQIPGFEILSRIGYGGMGVVYKARQLDADRFVAVKMILSGRGARLSDLARFRIEAEAIACLDHPNIIRIRKVGVHRGYPYFAIEYADGGSLVQTIRSGSRSPRWAAEVVRSAAQAMQMAHDRGILHRDLKPANVLLMADGTPKITDFGLAKFERPMNEVAELHATFGVGDLERHLFDSIRADDVLHNDKAKLFVDHMIQQGWKMVMGQAPTGSEVTIVKDYAIEASRNAGTDLLPDFEEPIPELTQDGMIMGSPRYMAPEQARGDMKNIGPCTDIYGLGAILYELLTGLPPFCGIGARQILEKVRCDAPAPIDAQINQELRAICFKCLEKHPEARYQSAAELADDLQRFLDGYSTLAGAGERQKTVEGQSPAIAPTLPTETALGNAPFSTFAIVPNEQAALGISGFLARSRWRRAVVGAVAFMLLVGMLFGMMALSSRPMAGDAFWPVIALLGFTAVLGAALGALTESE